MIRRGAVTGEGSDLVSVVVPVCNEETNVPWFHERLTAALAQHDFECIFVDDGSTDATPTLVRDIARQDPRFKLVSLSRNFGHQAAIFAGLTFARGAWIAVLDGDLQDPPELIPEMVRLCAKGADVVYGVHTSRKESWFKRAAAAAFYRLQARVTQTRMPVDSGDFAVMGRRVVDLIVSIGERHPYVRGLRSWVGLRQVPFPYHRDRRRRGEPKYTLWKLLDLAISGIVPFSVLPLRLVVLAGAVVSGLSCAGGAVIVLGHLAGLRFLAWEAPGSAGLWMAATFLFGIQLLVLGVIGEYLGRVLEEVQRRPIFVVDELVGLDPNPARPER